MSSCVGSMDSLEQVVDTNLSVLHTRFTISNQVDTVVYGASFDRIR